MSPKRSSLSSGATRSVRQLRPSKTAEGWGGDEEIGLSLVDDALPVRVEWVEGEGARWTLWVFEEDASPEYEDIFLVDDLGLALMAERVQENTTLKGVFHHYEVRCVEHEQSIADLETSIV